MMHKFDHSLEFHKKTLQNTVTQISKQNKTLISIKGKCFMNLFGFLTRLEYNRVECDNINLKYYYRTELITKLYFKYIYIYI